MRTSLLNLEAVGADGDNIGTAADHTPPLLETTHAEKQVGTLASRTTTYAESGDYSGVPHEPLPQSSMLLARPYEEEVSGPSSDRSGMADPFYDRPGSPQRAGLLSQAGHTIMQNACVDDRWQCDTAVAY